MKSHAKWAGLGLVALAVTVLSCAGVGGSFPTAERLALDDGSAHLPVDALARGRSIMLTECGACHRLFKPREYSPARWETLGDDMGKRTGLSPEQVEDLTLYLTTASARTSATR